MEPKLPKSALFHGTTEYVVSQIESGSNNVRLVYKDSNISLGGAYLTRFYEIAQVAAQTAAREHQSKPVILIVRIKYPLFPDEDWVVRASERPKDSDFDWNTESYKSKRYANFFADLFSEYIGDGHSLSDEYVRRYDELNARYGITWKDSLRYTGSVRQGHVITADQIIEILR